MRFSSLRIINAIFCCLEDHLVPRKLTFFAILTLRQELSFVFNEEEKKRLCLNRVTSLQPRSPNLWTSQSCFLSSNWFFQFEHSFNDIVMVIIEPAAP